MAKIKLGKALEKPFGVVLSEARRTVAVLGDPAKKLQKVATAKVKESGDEARKQLKEVNPLEQVIEDLESFDAAKASEDTLPTEQLDDIEAGLSGMSDAQLLQLSGLLDDHLDALGAAEQETFERLTSSDSREVKGAGGWVYRQFEDGTILIVTDGREGRGEVSADKSWKGRLLEPTPGKNPWQAISDEIGPYPAAAAKVALKVPKLPGKGKTQARAATGKKKLFPGVREPAALKIKGKTVKVRSPVYLDQGAADETDETEGVGMLGMDYDDPWEYGMAELRDTPVYGSTSPYRGDAVPWMVGFVADDVDDLDDTRAGELIGLIAECHAAGLDEDELEEVVDASGAIPLLGLFIGSRKKRLKRAGRQLAKTGSVKPSLLGKIGNDLTKIKAKIGTAKKPKRRAKLQALLDQILNFLLKAPGGRELIPPDLMPANARNIPEAGRPALTRAQATFAGYELGALVGELDSMSDAELAELEQELDASENEDDNFVTRRMARIDRKVERKVTRALKPVQRSLKKLDKAFPSEGSAGFVIGRLW